METKPPGEDLMLVFAIIVVLLIASPLWAIIYLWIKNVIKNCKKH